MGNFAEILKDWGEEEGEKGLSKHPSSSSVENLFET